MTTAAAKPKTTQARLKGLTGLPVKLVKLTDLVPFEGNPRRRYNRAATVLLAGSIRRNTPSDCPPWRGVISPLVVFSLPDGKKAIVCGSRRKRALEYLSAVLAPCIDPGWTREMAIANALAENVLGEGLHPIEEAEGLQSMIDAGYKVKQVADHCGRSVRWVDESLLLNNLAPEIKESFWEGKTPLVPDAVFVEVAKLPTHAGQLAVWKDMLSLSQSPTLGRDSVRNWVRRHMLHLADAQWGMEEKVGDAPACGPCKKRTDVQRTLFEEVKQDVGEAQCLDAECFAAKQDLLVSIKLDDGLMGIDKQWHNPDFIPADDAKPGAKLMSLVVTEGYDRGKVVKLAHAEDAIDYSKTDPAPLESQRRIHKGEKADIDTATALLAYRLLPFLKPIGLELLNALVSAAQQSVRRLVEKRCNVKLDRYTALDKSVLKLENFDALVWTMVLAARCEPFGEQRQALPNLLAVADSLRATLGDSSDGTPTRETVKALHDTWFNAKGKSRPDGPARYKARIAKTTKVT